MDPQLQALANCFKATVSPNSATRKQAEAQLKTQSTQRGFAIALLKLVKHFSSVTNDPHASTVCLSASIYFKRNIEQCWNDHESDEAGGGGGNKENKINAQDRSVIKEHLVDFMCAVPQKIQMQFSAAIGVISKRDFPDQWKTLLPKLVGRLDPKNLTTTVAVLKTAHAIFKRFRNVAKTDANLYPLKIALEQFQEPMLKIFQVLCQLLQKHGKDRQQRGNLEKLFVALTLIAKMMFSLCWLDLPEFFEDHMKDYFEPFHFFLNYSNPVVEADADEYQPSLGDKLKKSIVKVLNLYAGKYEEEFMPFFPIFAQDIWKQLKVCTNNPRHDKLVTASMQFLASVVQRNMHRKVFESEQALGSLCKEVIVPNLVLREHDEETLEDNPLEYIRTDIEGSDANTRRRGASDLVRALCKLFQAKVTPMCLQSANGMLQAYQADRSKWKLKDAAMNLILALAVRTQTAQHGANELNPGVNVMNFFPKHVLSELQSPNVDELPVIKADAIKFVTVFRQHMDARMYASLFPLILRHLQSKSIVVHTYAANWIERILVVKDKSASGSKLRFGRTALKPLLKPLLVGLFGLFERPNYMKSASAPDYIMKAIMRVVGVAKEDVMPFLDHVLGKLQVLVQQSAKNPTNPKYNHFMFEALAVLVRNVCGANRATVANFQRCLFPTFQMILANQIDEFMPYALQIMAQMLRLSPGGITKPFQAMFPMILHPTQYQNRGNVPALVELLKAYMVAPGDGPQSTRAIVVPQLNAVLGVWQKLCCSKATEIHAMRMLEVIVGHLPIQAYGKQLGTIFRILIQRLLKVKGPRFKFLFAPTFFMILGKVGGSAVVQSVESLKPGMFEMLMRQAVLPIVSQISGTVDRKKCAVGLARLLGETEQFRDPRLRACASECVVGALAFFKSTDPGAKAQDETIDLQEGIAEIEYNSMASFSRLNFATSKRGDAFANVKSVPDYLRQNIQKLNTSCPGLVGSAVGGNASALAALRELGVQI